MSGLLLLLRHAAVPRGLVPGGAAHVRRHGLLHIAPMLRRGRPGLSLQRLLSNRRVRAGRFDFEIEHDV